MVAATEEADAQDAPLPAAAPVLLFAAACFATALSFNFGYRAGGSFALAGLGVLALAAGLAVAHRRGTVARPGDIAPLALPGLLLAFFAVAAALAASDEPWSKFVPDAPHDAPVAVARALFLVALGLVTAGALRDSRRASLLRLGVLGLAFVLAADWTFAQSPVPAIDVWHMHQHAAGRLVHLSNPYVVSFANPYGTGTIDFYAYPPVTLLLQVPAFLAAGDVRWSSVVALAVAAWCARALARRSGLPRFAADAAAGLVLLQGRPFYMLEQGWTEPLVLGLAAVGALAWARRSSWAATALALALASKQFLWIYVPVLPWMGFSRRELARAALVLAAVLLPFFLWSPPAFWQGVVGSHVDGSAANAQFPDLGADDPWPNSNTVAVHLQQYDDAPQWPLWVGTVLWLATALAFVRSRRRDAGVLLGTAALGVAVVGYLGRAFHPNYLWLVAGLTLLGVLAHHARAAAPAPLPPSAARPSPHAQP